MRIEFLTPSCSCIGKEYVDVICALRDLFHQTLNFRDLRAVGGYRDGLGAGSFVGHGIESFTSGVACGLLSGGYVDFGAASLEKAEELVS